MANAQPVNSENIDTVSYDDESATMTLTFNKGGEYRYFGVPREIPEGLLNAASPGKYFFNYVRGQYRYQRVM